MVAKIKLSKKEAENLAGRIEDNGGDASILREVIGDETKDGTSSDVSDEEYIRDKLKDTPIEEGKELKCVVCGSKFDKLYSQTCQSCFSKWVLSCKEADEKSKRIDNKWR
ncbi:unnamed protein product [marine sediment metagenome]|uniref:Uncharacterized protein n=1 Tax=marine sediment metagenome TaxID=412755 RepID=X1T8T7_9ZZZZ